MRVFCYFNLHRLCFSVKALEGEHKGRVIAHADAVHLSAVRFKVSEAGRQRVLRENRKNVHAGAVGTLESFLPVGENASRAWSNRQRRFSQRGTRVTYNPYRFTSFVSASDETPVFQVPECLLHGRQVLALAADSGSRRS